MRVTLLSQFFPPETFAGANRVGAMANALAAEADVLVVTLQPSYPDPSAYTRVDPARTGIDAGVRVRRTRPFSPHRARSWTARALAEQRMALGLVAAARATRTDVVVASSPGMFLGPAGLALARLQGVPFVWDVRDLTWQYARERGTGAVTVAAGALESLMWAVARRADLLVSATPGIARALGARGLGTDVVAIGNTIDSDLLARLDPSSPPDDARPTVAYAGLVGHAQALGVLCDVAEELPEVDFEVAGDGPERAAIAAESRRRGLANLTCRGYLDQREVAALYRRSDVLFAQLHSSALHTSTALPSKLFEYMAAGRPIVYAGDGLAARTLREVGAGIAVAPGAAGEIGSAIRDLVANRAAARTMGLAGRRFVESQPSRQEAMAALLPWLRQLARGDRVEAAT